jgi:hypothetical protein
MKRVGDLEIDQDLTFQQREWQVQRVAWVVMALIIASAALGLFGNGLLSAATAGDPDGPISVEYERFVRHDGRASFTVRISADQVSGDSVAIWIAADYMADLEIEQMSPEPQEVRTDGDRLVYVLAHGETSGPLAFDVSFRPETIGRLSGEAGIVDGPQVTFTQISYP